MRFASKRGEKEKGLVVGDLGWGERERERRDKGEKEGGEIDV